MKRLRLALLAGAWLIPAVSNAAPSGAVFAAYFMEHEPGVEPYRTRVIVSSTFLRLDGGEDHADYVLFDRAKGIVYSVTMDERVVLVIPPRPMDAKPPKVFQHEVVRDNSPVPSIGKYPVKHYELKTNGKRCYDLYAAPDLLPEMVAAMRQFREKLAGQQAKTLPMTPVEMQTPCDLANNVFLSARHLAHGFPVRFTDMTGKMTELLDYTSEFTGTAGLLNLPEQFKRMTIEELRAQPLNR